MKGIRSRTNFQTQLPDLKLQTNTRMSEQAALSATQQVSSSLTSVTDTLNRMLEIARQTMDASTSESEKKSFGVEFETLRMEALNTANEPAIDGQKILVLEEGVDNTITVGNRTLDRSDIALIGKSNAQDGILTRWYNGVSFSDDAFQINDSSSPEHLKTITDALVGMLSNLRTAQYAANSIVSEPIINISPDNDDDDDGIYSPIASNRSGSNIRAQLEELTKGLANRRDPQGHGLLNPALRLLG